MLDPRDIIEVLLIKHGDIGIISSQINGLIKEEWIVLPDSYNYDHGLFTIMLVKVKEEIDILPTAKAGGFCGQTAIAAEGSLTSPSARENALSL